ncbi:MAG: AAA family ATPase [Planctomycetota bacterium]
MADAAPSTTNQARLQALVVASHPCISIVTHEEAYALDLIKATAAETGHRVLTWSATRGVTDGLFADSQATPNTEHPAAALYHLAHQVEIPALCVTLDLADHLDDARTLRALRDVVHGFRDNDSCLVMIDHRGDLSEVIAVETTRLDLALPTERQLERIIRDTLKRVHRRRPLEVKLRRSELQTIIRNLQGLTRDQVEQIIVDCVAEDRTFDAQDINSVLAYKRQRLHRDRLLQYVESPVDLSEIGGLHRLKRWLKRRRNALSDEAKAFGLTPPRGILLLGVQGAGKSLCAKATAAAWQRPLLRLDPGVLYDRYVGESERRLRSALAQAEAMAPIILWIDEIEKGFASAASHSTDGGLSQRMFGTLLTWMQEHEAPVFLLATANNVDALPPELLRKGRFDEIFFVDLPARSVRKKIFEIHLAKRDRDPGAFDLDALAEASEGYSGAEIEQAIVAALHVAFADTADLDTQRLLAALAESPPLSVLMAERVERLRAWARDRCVPAD